MSDSEILPQPSPNTNQSGSPAGDPIDLIEKAKQAADRLEAGNKELARLIALQQSMQVQASLAGRANAGTKTAMTDDEKELADAKKLLEGTGLEDYAFPNK